jgi:hypothetical protein
MGGSAQRFSIEDEECVPGGELATGGWAHLRQADCPRTTRLIIENMIRNLIDLKTVSGGRENLKRQGGSLNRPKEIARGWRQGRQDERVTCCPLPILGRSEERAQGPEPH